MDLSTFEPTTLVLCLRWSGAENGLRERRVFLVFFPFARSLALSLSLSAFRPSVRPSVPRRRRSPVPRPSPSHAEGSQGVSLEEWFDYLGEFC